MKTASTAQPALKFSGSRPLLRRRQLVYGRHRPGSGSAAEELRSRRERRHSPQLDESPTWSDVFVFLKCSLVFSIFQGDTVRSGSVRFCSTTAHPHPDGGLEGERP